MISCDICQRKFKISHSYHKHANYQHEAFVKSSWVKCDHCEFYFPTEEDIKKHLRPKHNVIWFANLILLASFFIIFDPIVLIRSSLRVYIRAYMYKVVVLFYALFFSIWPFCFVCFLSYNTYFRHLWPGVLNRFFIHVHPNQNIKKVPLKENFGFYWFLHHFILRIKIVIMLWINLEYPLNFLHTLFEWSLFQQQKIALIRILFVDNINYWADFIDKHF